MEVEMVLTRVKMAEARLEGQLEANLELGMTQEAKGTEKALEVLKTLEKELESL